MRAFAWSLLIVLAGCDGGPTPSAVPSTLANTRWCFPQNLGSVTFLADGTMKFSQNTSSGHWQQSGTKVVFDCNAFTEYRVELTGTQLQGDWVRLRGPQVGVTSGTRLELCGL